VSCVIAGARTADQLVRNVAAVSAALPADALARLDEATRPLKQALGPNPDMWQGEAGSRFY
jgi:aryl-alcohol dehydrogenase-like predicted oxidoreductase